METKNKLSHFNEWLFYFCLTRGALFNKRGSFYYLEQFQIAYLE